MILHGSILWLPILLESMSMSNCLEVNSVSSLTSVAQHLRRVQKLNPNNTESIEKNNEFLGIPGTTQTINGYDTALGAEPICWKGAAAELHENSTSTNATALSKVDQLIKTVFPNPLVENFTLLGKTEILDRCPKGNVLTVHRPQESIAGERLRTLRYYNYSLHLEIDLDTLDGDYIVTDSGNATIALQVVVCSLGKSGFCSPFVHEQANAREAIDKHNSGQKIVTVEKKVKGDLHGGTHIHSPWIFLDLGFSRTLKENVSIPMIVNHPGDYFVIGTIQLYTAINGSNAYRWDIANALSAEEGRYLLYQDPPIVNQVSEGVLYFSYVSIALSASVILFLIGQTCRHLDHQVLQLSQGRFLLLFLFGALISTACSFLLNPKNDVYCRISSPIIIIPIQLMYAITVGRMWRIHAVISPLLLEHLTKGRPGITQRFVEAITFISFKLHNLFVWKKKNRRRNRGGAKQQISQFQLALVIAIFTLPQVILQMVTFFVQPQHLLIDFNEDESIGRQTCGSDAPHPGQNLILYGFLMLFLLVVVLLVMAHSSRKLPSLFNETRVIYDSTFLSLILLLLGGAVVVLTEGPETSPDVQYLVSLVLILSITLNSGFRIMMPKFKMVWKNETVLVSKLVTDHHRKAREKQELRNTVKSSVIVSGLEFSNSNVLDSFKRDGDYDGAQTNKLLTIHSCSNDTAFALGGLSSVNSSEGLPGVREFTVFDPPNDGQRDHMDMENIDPGDGDLAVIPEAFPSKQPGNAMKVTWGESGSSAQISTRKSDGSNAKVNEPQIEHGKGSVEVAEGDEKTFKKTSSLNQAGGFIKHAMAKGLSVRLFEMTDRGRHTHNVQDDDEATSKSDKGEKFEAERNKGSSERTEHRVGRKTLKKTIVVTEDETPARRLVLKMLDLQDQLEAINNKIMSGLAVSQEDWRLITKLTSKLERTFSEEVEFEWEIERRCEETLKEVLPRDMSGQGIDDSADTLAKTGDPHMLDHSDDGRAQGMEKLTTFRSLRLTSLMRRTSEEKKDALGEVGSLHSVRSCPNSLFGEMLQGAQPDVDKALPKESPPVEPSSSRNTPQPQESSSIEGPPSTQNPRTHVKPPLAESSYLRPPVALIGETSQVSQPDVDWPLNKKIPPLEPSSSRNADLPQESSSIEPPSIQNPTTHIKPPLAESPCIQPPKDELPIFKMSHLAASPPRSVLVPAVCDVGPDISEFVDEDEMFFT